IAAHELAKHFGIDTEATPLGRPVADPGPDRNAPLQQPALTVVGLSGSASRFAKTFSWSFTDVAGKPTNSDAFIFSSTSMNAELLIDVPGSYRIQLVVNNGLTDSDPEIVVVTAFNGIDERSFVSDVAPVI